MPCRGGCGGRQAKYIFKIRRSALRRPERAAQAHKHMLLWPQIRNLLVFDVTPGPGLKLYACQLQRCAGVLDQGPEKHTTPKEYVSEGTKGNKGKQKETKRNTRKQMKTKGKQRETKGNKGKRRETKGNTRKQKETQG